jgi:hypothetical protein
MSLWLTLQRHLTANDRWDVPLLRKVFDKYGPVPCNVYHAYFRRGVTQPYDRAANVAIGKAPRSFHGLSSLVLSDTTCQDPDVSTKVACFRREGQDFDNYAKVLSPSVLNQFLKATAFSTLEMKRQVCEPFASENVTEGQTFKYYGHACLSRGDVPTFAAYKLTPVSDKYKHRRKSRPTPHLVSIILLTNSNTIHPYLWNIVFLPPPIIIVLISSMVAQAAVYIFQMSVSHEHVIDTPPQKGLGLL